MSNPVKRFCEELAETFPDLGNILNEHLAEYDELLPHPFMADVTRYVLKDGPQRVGIVQHLENAFKCRGEGIEELIAVSFVENIETRDELNIALNGVTNTNLRQQWERWHEK
jgi:hypothetical protein